MDSETAINKADILLREVPNVKIGNSNLLPKKIVKEELQFLHLSEAAQEKILETLKFIHGPDFKLDDSSNYEESKLNFLKKYWVGQGNLVVKGGFNYSSLDDSTEESERIKQFGLLRVESYGFHRNHCIEAYEYCDYNVEDSLHLLFQKYYNHDGFNEIDHGLSNKELLELRMDEKSSLESIYEKSFVAKTDNVWILTLKLDYLVNIFHNKKIKKVIPVKSGKEKCRNIIRTGQCRFGDKCRFSHEIEEKVEKNVNIHLEDFQFELEIRFPPNTKYPYEPPLIFLKTNAVITPLVNLHICQKLYEESKLLAQDGIPCVYTITEMLKNESEIKEHLEREINLLSPNQKLFDPNENLKINKIIRPSHYKKGQTNRDNKKISSPETLKRQDQLIVNKFVARTKESERYKKMLDTRENLPAWKLKNDILNTINRSQVVVISGETGCGKSTQVPQFVLDEWISNFNNNDRHIEIICTQPRRISAIGVAERVAEERLEKVGETVGYQIRLENKISNNTRLTFCTTGILLRRLEGDPTLPNVTHIVVDEVHERTEESDFLLLILKELLPVRPDLKVILMSATMNATLFCQYFDDIPIINIPGRTFPVEQYFLEDILDVTGYILEDGSEYSTKSKRDYEMVEEIMAAQDVSYTTAAMPKDTIRDEGLKLEQIMTRYYNNSKQTCKNIYLMDPDKINYELIETVILWIISDDHDYPKTGSILVFLPGFAEITAMYEQLSVHPEIGSRKNKFIILPLHSTLTSEEQAAIFRKPQFGQRKIILSTNLAETSITIDDCVFVIDSGKMKEKRFDPNRNMESLDTVWVTRANALQRKGRAGRVMSGVCIHLFTSNRFKYHLQHQPLPEVQRIPLEKLILNVKILANFEDRDAAEVIGAFIEPPPNENISTAIKRLENVGALDKSENLTPLGHHLAALPVDVRIGKLILYGAIFCCVDAALTMAACLSYKSPFVSPFDKREEANKKKLQFSAGYSDQITSLIAYKKFLQVFKKSFGGGRNFANENYMSFKTLITLFDIKHQFLEYLVDIGFVPINLKRRRLNQDIVFEITGTEFNKNGENLRLLTSILCAALYPNVVKVLTPSKSYVMSSAGAVPKENEAKDLKFATSQDTVFMHPSSVNYKVTNFQSPFLVYQEKVQTSKIYFRECTMVPIIPLILFTAFDLNITVQGGNTFILLEDGWIIFKVEEHKVAEMIKLIRKELFDLLEEKIKDPLLNLLHHEKGNKIISTILTLINS